ncbi:MAG: transposase [Lentimicrobiaceae bacterium]|nr:transposase [Lentimicrobiaceae bacterium]
MVHFHRIIQPYFHVVFTLPDKLNGLFLANPSAMYRLLFKAAWNTLSQFFLTKLHAQAGMITILHTWGQTLSYHPHLHCIVPAGGIGIRGQWKQVKLSASGKVYLFPAENLSRVFRGKFMEGLNNLMSVDSGFKKELYRSGWVVYTKDPFAGPESVLEYLVRYTHKTAISNHRILKVDPYGVTFRWRDYRDNQQKVMTLEGVEFLRRFSHHILNKGFVRIRHFGFLSATHRPVLHQLQHSMGVRVEPTIKREHWKEICRRRLGYDPDICPECGQLTMVTIERFLPGRGPPLVYRNQLIHSSQNQHQ